MEKPFFSIIIPTLNEEKYLPILLTSLANQTERSFEVIVSNGASKDKTVEIAKEYTDQFPLRILSSQKKGVSCQRNIGAGSAIGEYLLFLDADVRFEASFLQLLKKKLEIYKTDFATTRSIPDNRNISDYIMTYMANLIMWFSSIFFKPFMGGQCLIVSKKVFDTLKGFDERVIMAEDHEFIQRAWKKGYRGKYFYSPLHAVSFRRFDREGRIKVVLKWTESTIHVIFKGPIYKPLFDYPMGGNIQNH